MDKKSKKFIDTNGYIIVRNIVPINLLDQMIKLIASRFTEITKIKLKEKLIQNHKVSKELDNNLYILRKNNPEIFGYLYDSIQSSVLLNQLFTNKIIIKNLCKISGIKQESFSTSGLIQRLDPPDDKKNLYSWHQETSYYRQNNAGKQCYFIWIPIINTNKKNGSIIIAKGSHKNGFIKTKLSKKAKLESEQRTIQNKYVSNLIKIQPNLKRGDACILNFNTIHKSGKNNSDSFRYSAIGRYHYTNTKEFKPFRYKVKFNNLKIKN